MARWNLTVSQRFWKNVHATDDGCWVWHGCVDGHGYGTLHVNGATKYAHRFSYEIANGVIPPGLCVCHRCDTPLCVRPDHLFLGTRQENNADRDRKRRTRPGKSMGAAHGMSKLTEAQALEILQSSESSRVMAARYAVTPALIRMIRRRVIWKHLAPRANVSEFTKASSRHGA